MPGQEKDDGRIGGGTKRQKEQVDEDGEGTSFDLVIGCDGSWSKVRSEMMRVVRSAHRHEDGTMSMTDFAVRLDFSQSFIPHAYIELPMPADPSKPGGYAIDKNHLHIWPRHSFMLIALPNKVSFLFHDLWQSLK